MNLYTQGTELIEFLNVFRRRRRSTLLFFH